MPPHVPQHEAVVVPDFFLNLLPQATMEPQKGAYEDASHFEMGLFAVPCLSGTVDFLGTPLALILP